MHERFEFESTSQQAPQARARMRMLVMARNSRSAISASAMLSKAGPWGRLSSLKKKPQYRFVCVPSWWIWDWILGC